MAWAGHSLAILWASTRQRLPIPVRCSSGLTAMSVRYSGFLQALKQVLSIAQGFFVASVRLAISPCSPLATQTREVRRWWSTPLSEETEDQGPLPYWRVRCSATAVRSAAIAGASSTVAGSRTRRTLGPERQPVRQGMGEAGFADAALRLLNGIFDPVPADDAPGAVVGHVGGPRIAVAGLADGAGVDEVAPPGIELDAAARAAQGLHSQQPPLQPEERRDVGVAEEGHRHLVAGEDLPGVDVGEDVGVLVERRAVADGEPLLHLHRPLGEAADVAEVGRSEPAGGPLRRRQGRLVEVAAGVD